MAGAGYKLFNAGDVLSASDVNTYMMQQTVMVFANSSARTSALSTVLAEGMVSYLQDTNSLEVYDGTAWVGATGDITGLTAGTGVAITSATGPVPTVGIDTAVVPRLGVANTFTTGTQTINTGATGTTGLIVNGASGQTADLVRFNVNGVFGGARVSAGGNYFIAPGITANYTMDTTAGAANVTPFVVNGAASQTANLTSWRDSSGNVLSRFDSSGRLIVGNTVGLIQVTSSGTSGSFPSTGSGIEIVAGSGAGTDTIQSYNRGTSSWRTLVIRSAKTTVQAGVNTDVALTVLGATSSASADLTQWQTTSGISLLSVNSLGDIGTPSGSTRAARFRYFDNPNTAGAYIDTLLSTGTLGVVGRVTTSTTFVVKGATSQTANLQEWQDSAGTIKSRVLSDGTLRGNLQTQTGHSQFSEFNGGGYIMFNEASASATSGNTAKVAIWVVTGTNANTLKLVARSNGAEVTILDNIPKS